MADVLKTVMSVGLRGHGSAEIGRELVRGEHAVTYVVHDVSGSRT
jgi:hypothetical protein